MYEHLLKQSVQKHTAGNEATANALRGPGGIFSTPDLDRNIISTVVQPKGIGALLPAVPSNVNSTYYGLLTSIEDASGTEPDEVCDNALTADLKSGMLATPWGRLQTKTETIELGEAILFNSGVGASDLQLMGSLLGDSYVHPNVSEDNVLNNQITAQMVAASFSLGRKFNRLVWQGNPANATTGGGYKPATGFNLLVKTGHIDAETSAALPAADSTIVDGDFGEIGAASSPYDIVGELRGLMGYLESVADDTVNGATFAIVMRPEVWSLVSDVWAAGYASELAGSVGGASLNIDAAALMSARDNMKTSKMLPIGANVYPVVTDNGIKQLTNADDGTNIPVGSYSSSIFIIPLTVAGGLPVTYFEYLDWTLAEGFLRQASVDPTAVAFWTDSGRFIWTGAQKRTCLDFQVRVDYRLILKAPHLAARIDDLLTTPAYLPRTPYSDEAGYVGGGVASRT